MKTFATALLVTALIFCCASDGHSQNYTKVVESLKKLDSTIQVIKEYYEAMGAVPRQYADADAAVSPEDMNRDLMYDFALNFERVVGDLSTAMTEAKAAEDARPKNPASAGHGKITIGGYLHQQFTSQFGDDEEAEFVSKRARLLVKGQLNKYAQIRLFGEFAGSPKLLDGRLTLSPNEHWSLEFGQYKPPFGTEFQYAASKWPFVSTSAVKKIGTDRDIGTHLTYKNKVSDDFKLALKAGVFNGSGINTSDANTDKNFVARGEFTFGGQFTIAPNAYIGKTNDTGSAMEDLNIYGGSATWKWKNEIIEGEYIQAETGDVTEAGWYAWAGHTFKTNASILPAVQLLARYAAVDPNTDVDNDGTNTLTLGTNLFIDGKYTKLQLNYNINGEEGTSVDNDEFLMNFQVAF